MSGKRIPVNIITGFLGVGKTTAILYLLSSRPEGETWAVLVNEFGKVPIDEAAMRAIGEDGMQIAEVSGGCLCCTAGVDTGMALKRLVEEVTPDRILIEPTGLGHPDRIREAILDGVDAAEIRPAASICLVDPRQCIKPGIENILSYWKQVSMADVIVVNKIDLVEEETLQSCRDLLDTKFGKEARIFETQEGRIPACLLEGNSKTVSAMEPNAAHPHHDHAPHEGGGSVIELLEGKARREESSGLEHFGCGWRFDASIRFSLSDLESFFNGILEDDHRIKGIFRTDQGWAHFSAVGKDAKWQFTRPSSDSRLEHIQGTEPEDWSLYEKGLLDCRL